MGFSNAFDIISKCNTMSPDAAMAEKSIFATLTQNDQRSFIFEEEYRRARSLYTKKHSRQQQQQQQQSVHVYGNGYAQQSRPRASPSYMLQKVPQMQVHYTHRRGVYEAIPISSSEDEIKQNEPKNKKKKKKGVDEK